MTTTSIADERATADRTGPRIRLGTCGAIVTLGLVNMIGGIGAFGPGTSETQHIGPTENAASTTLGPVRVDDAYVVAPTGGPASLRFTLVDQGAAPDRLTGVDLTTSSTRTGTPTFHPLALEPGQMIDLDTSGAGTPLPARAKVVPGSDVTIHFQFADAGGTSLAVPVVASTT